jgi:hypothetical protein
LDDPSIPLAMEGSIMAAATLEGRLLCASASAYAVAEGEGRLDPETAVPYYAGVGFVEPPAAFLAGTDDINACLVGTTTDGVVVAFRGTLPLDGPFTIPLLLDWVNDLNARPIPGDGLPGGFTKASSVRWTRYGALYGTRRSGNWPKPAARRPSWSPGTAKAAPSPRWAAMRFLRQETVKPTVVTFAAPKPGNTAFANAYNAAIEHTRYEFAEDVVPHLPPSASFLGVLSAASVFSRRLPDLEQFDYGRVGKLLYITRELQIVPDPNNSLLAERRERIVGLVLTGHLQRIGDDHRIACGYGYMSALNPSGVCPPPGE